MKNLVVTILAIGFIGFASCKKYEEGPAISFRSKTARVANTWKVEQYLFNGADETNAFNALFPNYREVYDKEGNYSYSFDTNNTGSGRWEFQSNNEEIKRSGVSSQPTETLVILKLKEKEFWYYYMDGNDRSEFHMICAE